MAGPTLPQEDAALLLRVWNDPPFQANAGGDAMILSFSRLEEAGLVRTIRSDSQSSVLVALTGAGVSAVLRTIPDV